jgi:hypothetical protein
LLIAPCQGKLNGQYAISLLQAKKCENSKSFFEIPHFPGTRHCEQPLGRFGSH